MGREGGILADVYARRLSGLEEKLVYSSKLAENMVKFGIHEFVD